MSFHTLAVTGAERVKAIQSEFAGRSDDDMTHVYILVGMGVVALFSALAIVYSIQDRRRKQQATRHRAELEARLRQPVETSLR